MVRWRLRSDHSVSPSMGRAYKAWLEGSFWGFLDFVRPSGGLDLHREPRGDQDGAHGHVRPGPRFRFARPCSSDRRVGTVGDPRTGQTRHMGLRIAYMDPNLEPPQSMYGFQKKRQSLDPLIVVSGTSLLLDPDDRPGRRHDSTLSQAAGDHYVQDHFLGLRESTCARDRWRAGGGVVTVGGVKDDLSGPAICGPSKSHPQCRHI